MNIKETIMHYIDVYDGSEDRIIKRTVSDLYSYKEADAIKAVEASISWLLDNEYIKSISYKDMTDMQKRYYESDCCPIYGIIKRYNENEYFEEIRIRNEAEAKLSPQERFKLYFDRMEKKTKKLNSLAKIGYTISLSEESIIIEQIENAQSITIDLNKIENIYYDENENNIYYTYNGKAFTIEERVFSNVITFANFYSIY